MIVAEIQDTNFIMVVTYIPPNNTKYYSDIYFDNLRNRYIPNIKKYLNCWRLEFKNKEQFSK